MVDMQGKCGIHFWVPLPDGDLAVLESATGGGTTGLWNACIDRGHTVGGSCSVIGDSRADRGAMTSPWPATGAAMNFGPPCAAPAELFGHICQRRRDCATGTPQRRAGFDCMSRAARDDSHENRRWTKVFNDGPPPPPPPHPG